jgi:hypothetical protein
MAQSLWVTWQTIIVPLNYKSLKEYFRIDESGTIFHKHTRVRVFLYTITIQSASFVSDVLNYSVSDKERQLAETFW